MTHAAAAQTFIDGLLGHLEDLSVQLIQYDRAPGPNRCLEQMQALCFDLEDLFVAWRAATDQPGVAAAQDWAVSYRNYARAADHACDAIKAVGWLWARGVSDDHADTTSDAVRDLKEAASDMLRSTIELAQMGERLARDAGFEASPARPDLVERFAAVRAGCARACAGLRAGRLGHAARSSDGEG